MKSRHTHANMWEPNRGTAPPPTKGRRRIPRSVRPDAIPLLDLAPSTYVEGELSERDVDRLCKELYRRREQTYGTRINWAEEGE